MRNLVQLESVPYKVRFAGWESDTWRLQKSGWQIAANDIHVPWKGHNTVQLILRHEPSRMHAMTAPLNISPMIYGLGNRYQNDQMAMTAEIGFDVVAMGSQVVVRHLTTNPVSMWSDFNAVNCEPNTIQTDEINLESLKIFRPISSTAPEIIIPTHSVAEMMDLVLKLQDPAQAEIRERRRKEKMREDWQSGQGYDAHADIKCQILAFG